MDEDKGIEFLAALGIEVQDVRYGELVSLCPKHEERTGKKDHSPSWSFNPELGVFHCFSCGYSGSSVQLIVDMLDLRNRWDAPDFDAAEEWLNSFDMDLGSLGRKVKRLQDRFSSYEGPAPKPVPMTEARLALYVDPPEWALTARDLDLVSCKTYGVLWDDDADCWILPIRSPEDHKLLGYQVKGQGNRTFMNRPAGIKKSQTFFGWNTVAADTDTVIVVESPLDAVKMFMVTGIPSLAVMGAKLSDAQIDLLLRFDTVILALDNDKAGKTATRHFYTQARKTGMMWKQFAYNGSGAKDPGDMTTAQIKRGVSKAVNAAWGLTRLLEA
jgi:DNA primase